MTKPTGAPITEPPTDWYSPGTVAELLKAERQRTAEFFRRRREEFVRGSAAWDTLGWVATMVESGEAGQVPGNREA